MILEQATKLNQPGLMLASENAQCLSMRLKEKAEQLRHLCDNAKTWDADMKRAGANLRRRLEAARPKKVTIEAPKVNGKSHAATIIDPKLASNPFFVFNF